MIKWFFKLSFLNQFRLILVIVIGICFFFIVDPLLQEAIQIIDPNNDNNNIWYHKNESETVFVFLHGILSDSKMCWSYEDALEPTNNRFWPQMIKNDHRFGKISIYLAGYYTSIDSKDYDIRQCARDVFRSLQRDLVLEKKNLILVTHSTGGIVARYILENFRDEFSNKKIGVVLIASPSYGSKLASKLDLLTSFYNNSLGKQLAWGSWSLKELDSRFKELRENKKIPEMYGVEAYEHHFILHRKYLPDVEIVVEKESAGRYFGDPILLADTNHFTCVKPDNPKHPSYLLLLDFCNKYKFIQPYSEEESNLKYKLTLEEMQASFKKLEDSKDKEELFEKWINFYQKFANEIPGDIDNDFRNRAINKIKRFKHSGEIKKEIKINGNNLWLYIVILTCILIFPHRVWSRNVYDETGKATAHPTGVSGKWVQYTASVTIPKRTKMVQSKTTRRIHGVAAGSWGYWSSDFVYSNFDKNGPTTVSADFNHQIHDQTRILYITAYYRKRIWWWQLFTS